MNKLYEESLKRGTFWVSTKENEEKILFPKQVHGNKIASLSQLPCEADGIWWKWDELDGAKMIAVYTADCLPILIEGEKGGALLHAGWRGLQSKIHIDPIIQSLRPHTALIGPSIQGEHFEVTEEFFQYFPNSSHFFEKNKKTFFNLQAQAKGDLRSVFPNLKIVDKGLCTFQNIQYNSHRRDKSKKRNYNIYQLKE